MVRMPRTIRVSPHVYNIARRAAKGDHGALDPGVLEIGVKRGLRRSKAQEILLHEVIHACVPAALERGPHSEEDFVVGITAALLGVIQDNPDLVKYLQEK